MFEIYKSIKGRKTYLVFAGTEKADTAYEAAKKYFRVAEHHLSVNQCWILNDDLYFEDPHKKAAKKKIAIYWKK